MVDLIPVLIGIGLIALSVFALSRAFRSKDQDVSGLAARVEALIRAGAAGARAADVEALADAVDRLRRQVLPRALVGSDSGDSSAEFDCSAGLSSDLSGSFAFSDVPAFDPLASSDFTTLDMVNRLDPKTLRWLESSRAEQEFLGWSLDELRSRSFLEIVNPDHVALAREQLLAAVAKGEAHGLVYRIKSATGEPKAVQLNVGVRYAADHSVSHLRCHVTDVTDKLRAGRELRRRTRELTLANEQLRGINSELQELKDRYGDLYQNAPVMYFSLDRRGVFTDCNKTMLQTLGYRRVDLIGRHFTALLPEPRHPSFAAKHAEFLRTGLVELESRWRKADGCLIDIWVKATAVRDPDGVLLHSRSVAQDVTARKALEAQLLEQNDRLALANAELSRKNQELDEFTHIVSHDLNEPLRTMIAFSGFLLEDHGEQLNDEARQFVRHLVDASRRMRTLIQDLLQLSHAGRVTGDFAPVNLDEVVEMLLADFTELIRSRKAELKVVTPLPTLWGDRDRIAQLFGNLICNGFKYNQSDNPCVEISSGPGGSPGFATVSVRDNGIGIDPRFHARIFQVFRRLHTREEYEGTGAGLAICQKIAQAHGGQITVQSEPGQGTTFIINLPIGPTRVRVTFASGRGAPCVLRPRRERRLKPKGARRIREKAIRRTPRRRTVGGRRLPRRRRGT
ncbi:MAG: ATP-binding protein [Isosphaeraceae bacterium]